MQFLASSYGSTHSSDVPPFEPERSVEYLVFFFKKKSREHADGERPEGPVAGPKGVA